MEKKNAHDVSKRDKVLKQRRTALKLAVDDCCHSLRLDYKYDLYVLHRLFSLWFDASRRASR